MAALGYHVTMRLLDGRVIAPSLAMRRVVARIVYAKGNGYGLVAFRLADTHLHVLLACSRAEAGAFARHAACALRFGLALTIGFEPSRRRAIEDQRHFTSAFWYLVRQDAHHGTDAAPWHDGSPVPDVLGTRVLLGAEGAVAATLARAHDLLPRVQTRELLTVVGGEPMLSAPPAFERLTDAAAAFGLPRLVTRADASAVERRAAMRVAGPVLGTTRAGAMLELGPRTASRYANAEVPATHLRAVTLQLRMRAHHARATVSRHVGTQGSPVAHGNPRSRQPVRIGSALALPRRHDLRGCCWLAAPILPPETS